MGDIGSTLRDERIRRGLGIDEIEAGTKIRAKYLMALEDERFEVLPGAAYARAFLRDYAEELGLDPQSMIDRLNTVFEVEDDVVLAPPRPIGPGPILGRWQWIGLALAAVAMVATIVAVAVSLLGSSGAAPGAAVGSQAGARLAQQSPPATSNKTTTRPPLPRFAIAASGNTWLEVRRGSASGHVLYRNVLAASGRLRFRRHRLWMRVGAPWNLTVTANGRKLALPIHAAGTVLVTQTGVRLG
jgi:hypothetical protein